LVLLYIHLILDTAHLQQDSPIPNINHLLLVVMAPPASAAASAIGDPSFEFIMSVSHNSESVNLVKTSYKGHSPKLMALAAAIVRPH
jgi:hypothetical protein